MGFGILHTIFVGVGPLGLAKLLARNEVEEGNKAVAKVQKGCTTRTEFFNLISRACLASRARSCVSIVASIKSCDPNIPFRQFKFSPIGKFSLFAEISLRQIFRLYGMYRLFQFMIIEYFEIRFILKCFQA